MTFHQVPGEGTAWRCARSNSTALFALPENRKLPPPNWCPRPAPEPVFTPAAPAFTLDALAAAKQAAMSVRPLVETRSPVLPELAAVQGAGSIDRLAAALAREEEERVRRVVAQGNLKLADLHIAKLQAEVAALTAECERGAAVVAQMIAALTALRDEGAAMHERLVAARKVAVMP